MWKGYGVALCKYYNCFLITCLNKWKINVKAYRPIIITGELREPVWLGYEPLHFSHRGNLLRKNFEFYKQYGWKEVSMNEYYWPVAKDGSLREEIIRWKYVNN